MTGPLPFRASFAERKPWFQFAWDSSSLGAYLRCPRRYFYQQVCGFRPIKESVDLRFGTLVHAGMEVYHEEKPARGHSEAQVLGLEAILQEAWQGEGKGYWLSTSTAKNLWSALRAFIWHTEQFLTEVDFRTTVVGDSLLAVELPFRFDLDLEVAGEEALYCGHMDRVVETSAGLWVVDYKTTKSQLSSHYFSGYMPSTQLPGYDVAARIVLQKPIQGVVIDAFQIGVNFVRCARGHILLGEGRAEEWLQGSRRWITDAMQRAEFAEIEWGPDYTTVNFATANAHNWPMNTESCFICPFRPVCSSTPSIRGHLLEGAYVQEFWDPLARQTAVRARELTKP